jgi:hypothetical protein
LLLLGEDAAAYDGLFAGIHAAVKPVDTLEEMLGPTRSCSGRSCGGGAETILLRQWSGSARNAFGARLRPVPGDFADRLCEAHLRTIFQKTRQTEWNSWRTRVRNVTRTPRIRSKKF